MFQVLINRAERLQVAAVFVADCYISLIDFV